MSQSPTSRTLQECRRRGWIAQVVERRIPGKWITLDLFGCIDIVAVTPATDSKPGETIGIQACIGGDHATRLKKSLAEPRLSAWLGAGNRFEVWSWDKQGKAGKRKVWMLREEAVGG